MSKLKNAKKKDKEITNDQISTGIFDPRALKQLTVNRLTELYKECLKQSEEIALSTTTQMYSTSDFNELLNVIKNIQIIGDDSVLRVFDTYNSTVDELSSFKEGEPWNYRRILLYDMLLGKSLTIGNMGVIKRFRDEFNTDDVNSNLEKLSYIQNNTALIQQEFVYRNQLEEAQAAHRLTTEGNDGTYKLDVSDDADSNLENYIQNTPAPIQQDNEGTDSPAM